MKCASFFSGIGGIDIGFHNAGFETIFANEFDKNALLTLQNNFNFQINDSSIIDIDEDKLPNFDVMLAGFPCQSFSIAGKRDGFNNKKSGSLFFELERIFSHKKPKVIFLENVKNLISHDNGNTFRTVIDILNKYNYYVKYKVLNTYLHGNLPQNRERIFIVAFKNRRSFELFDFPNEIPLTVKINDMLIDNVDNKYYYTNKYKIFNELKKNMKNTNSIYQWRRKYVRENKKNICPTLTANMGSGGHNVPLIIENNGKIRKLTPRECLNFQGFPSSFVLPKISDCYLYKQAGNSVSIPIISRIALNIMKVL